MNFEVISRREAYRQSKKHFYTGVACKHGHLALRYVSNGACTVCLNFTFKHKVNSFTADLAPYIVQKLWCPKVMTRDEMIMLRHHLQNCIYIYCQEMGAARKLRPSWWTDGISQEAVRHSASLPDLNNPQEYP